MRTQRPRCGQTDMLGVTLGVLLAFCLLVGWASASPDGSATAPSTQPVARDPKLGTLTGAVLTHDGLPAAEFALRIVEEQPLGMGGGPRGQKLTVHFKTDKDGKFEVTNIKPSPYKIIAGNKDVGWIYMDVQIEPGKTETVDLKLTKIGS